MPLRCTKSLSFSLSLALPLSLSLSPGAFCSSVQPELCLLHYFPFLLSGSQLLWKAPDSSFPSLTPSVQDLEGWHSFLSLVIVITQLFWNDRRVFVWERESESERHPPGLDPGFLPVRLWELSFPGGGTPPSVTPASPNSNQHKTTFCFNTWWCK